MVISFRLSGRRRRYHPPPPPPTCACAAATPHATTSLEGPSPPPRPPWEAAGSWIDSGNATPLDLHERNDVDPVEPDLEPSFALNLFLDGYSTGEPGKGMLTYLIGDDPKKRPYSRASKTLFSDIEYGCLPLEVLHDIPCKFRNGSTVCEVRDYRLVSNGGDCSRDDFPKVNRVSLRLGTECVVKDLSSIVDASWTYQDQLMAESVILNALQPRLNLNPTACLEMLCSCKKIDLGLEKGRQQAEENSIYISANVLGNCKRDQFNGCKSRPLCIEDEALVGSQSAKLNSASVNRASMILVNNAKSPAESESNNTVQSYTRNNSAFSDERKESASSIASENLVQCSEMQMQVVTSPGDSRVEQQQIGIVASYKRKKCSNLVEERHQSKKRSCPNKTAILNSQHPNVSEKSTGISHKERLDLGTPKVPDQIIDGKDMKVKQEPCEAPVVYLLSSGPETEDFRVRRTSSATSFSWNPRVTAFKPHVYKAGTEPKHTASKGNILGISTISSKQELKFKKKRQKNVDTLHKSLFENRSAEKLDVIGGISSQLGLVLDNTTQQTKDTSVLRKTAVQRCKRNKSSKVLHEKNKSKTHIPPSKTEGLVSESYIGLQKLEGTSNKEGLELGSLNEMHAMVDQETGSKSSMEVPQQFPLPVLQTSHLYTSSKVNNPCMEKMLGNNKSMYVKFKGREAPAVVLENSSMADLRGNTTPSVSSFNAGSRKVPFKRHEDKPETEPQCAASNRKVSVTSTVSSNLEINSEGKTQGTINMRVKSFCEDRSPPCSNRSSEVTRVNSGTDRKLNTSPNQRSYTEHCMHTSEPDIEKILSEGILTTQRHRLDRKAARNDGLGTTSSLVQSECFQQENTEKYPYIREEMISYYATGRVTSNCKIRRIAFHPSQYFSCKGIVDDSHYTLCLLESQAPDDHQIIVGTIYGDEHMHIATLPTYCYAEKFVDQFISLMKRDGYNLCEDTVLTEPSELRQQLKDVSQLCYDTGECAQYLMPSLSVVNSSAIMEDNNVCCTFQNKVPDYVNLLQQESDHWVMTQQSRSLGVSESFFLNPSRSSGLQNNNIILQHMRPSFAMNLHQVPSVQLSNQVSMGEYGQHMHCRHDDMFAIDLHQFPSVQLSEVSMDEYWQHRHYVPGFSDMYRVGTSASSYGQWHSVPTQLGNVVYQWDLPASVREINNSSLPHDGPFIPWSELHPIRSPP